MDLGSTPSVGIDNLSLILENFFIQKDFGTSELTFIGSNQLTENFRFNLENSDPSQSLNYGYKINNQFPYSK